MSLVPLVASRRPTSVASARSRATTSVRGCRRSLARRGCRLPDRLCQRSAGDDDGDACFVGEREERYDPPLVAVELDHRPCIEGDTAHAEERSPKTSLAQLRSAGVRSPPVSRRAWASIAPQPVMSSSDTCTACWTKPDTLSALPAATRSRIAATASGGRVTVTLLRARHTDHHAGIGRACCWLGTRRATILPVSSARIPAERRTHCAT